MYQQLIEFCFIENSIVSCSSNINYIIYLFLQISEDSIQVKVDFDHCFWQTILQAKLIFKIAIEA